MIRRGAFLCAVSLKNWSLNPTVPIRTLIAATQIRLAADYLVL
jgi:hypothetical protein